MTPLCAPLLIALGTAFVAGSGTLAANRRLKSLTGWTTFDLQLRPTAAGIRQVTDTWGGCSAHVGLWIGLAFGLDALLIAAYLCSFEFALSLLHVTAGWAVAAPLGCAVADVCEDVLEVRMILVGPSPGIATVSFSATAIKWLLFFASLGLCGYGVFAHATAT